MGERTAAVKWGNKRGPACRNIFGRLNLCFVLPVTSSSAQPVGDDGAASVTARECTAKVARVPTWIDLIDATAATLLAGKDGEIAAVGKIARVRSERKPVLGPWGAAAARNRTQIILIADIRPQRPKK